MFYTNTLAMINKNSLLKNAVNLIFSTGLSALFGFVFWILIARHFHSSSVGLATTLLSMSGLLSLLGLAGFDTVFVRYLPKSTSRNEHINTGLIVASLVTALLSILFCMFLPIISPSLKFINHNPLYVISFVVFTVFTVLNTLTNAILVAYRRTSFIVLINIITSLLKMILPLIFSSGGSMLIFTFVGITQVVNVVLSIAVLMKHFEYRPSFKINFTILREIRRYGFAAGSSNILNLLPDFILPIIVINQLGPSQAAYFYIAFTIANLLYTITFATNQALLAESSHEESDVIQNALKGIKISSCLLIPISLAIIVLCPFVLNIFGHGYNHGAVGILRILSLSSLAVMLYSASSFIFKHTKNLKGMLVMTFVNAAAIIGLSGVLVKHYGLIGIGWAWFIGTCLAIVTAGIVLKLSQRRSLLHES